LGEGWAKKEKVGEQRIFARRGTLIPTSRVEVREKGKTLAATQIPVLRFASIIDETVEAGKRANRVLGVIPSPLVEGFKREGKSITEPRKQVASSTIEEVERGGTGGVRFFVRGGSSYPHEIHEEK